MTENKRFIIYMGEPYYNNVFFKYDESADDYQFLCRTSDFGSILEELNALADEIEQKNETNQKLYDNLQETKSEYSLKMGEVELIKKENERLKQEIKDLRLLVLDSIKEADEIQCTCNPCVVEECVKKVVE